MAFDEKLRRRVKTVCCMHGVGVLRMKDYWNFAQQVEKTRKRVQGNDVAVIAAASIERYVKLGLARKVPEAIRSQVLSIAAPIAP